jgi:hypothetical protein
MAAMILRTEISNVELTPTDGFEFFKLPHPPHPQLRQITDTQTFQRTLRATQVRCAMGRAYTVILKNRPLRHLV